MKTISSLKSTKNDSPKTPGGISKSLLTPCRRVGLSRNWKKTGPSPFISPLTSSNSNSVEVKFEKKETRKRKKRVTDEEVDQEDEELPKTPVETDDDECNTPMSSRKCNDIGVTPTRPVALPHKKKSKILLSSIVECKENTEDVEVTEIHSNSPNIIKISNVEINIQEAGPVATPIRSKSKSKKNIRSQKSTLVENIDLKKTEDISQFETEVSGVEENTAHSTKAKENIKDLITKPKSPNELTKECIVVIQKKIFKTDKKTDNQPEDINVKNEIVKADNSQTLFDSDSDEVPLSRLNKKNIVLPTHKQDTLVDSKVDPKVITLDDDDDEFIDANKVNVKKLEEKPVTTVTKLATKQKSTKTKLQLQRSVPEPKPSSQSSNSFDDDEDFDFENKRTILIRKTYEKVTKPIKAKSTGSITQKDIDELKARIEMKKKLLLAKAMTTETEELRTLIKKWQKGCQDALMELMDLMKNKFSDKQNMDYSEMLQMLKIPSDLVGYDAENDCFLTPDDASIILSKFND